MNNGVIKQQKDGKNKERRSKKGKEIEGNNQSVMFQVYTYKKPIDLSLISLTPTEHNINTSVEIMFHMTYEDLLLIMVHVSCSCMTFSTCACIFKEEWFQETFLLLFHRK